MTVQANDHIKVNIMEELVNEEIARQVKDIPQDINCVEVATYVLNRLPSLYASCHKGANKQRLKGRSEYRSKITKFVRCGIVLVKQDVFRKSFPLKSPDTLEPDQIKQLKESANVLSELSQLLPSKKITWDEIIETVKSYKNSQKNNFIFEVDDFENVGETDFFHSEPKLAETFQGNSFVFEVDDCNEVGVSKSNIEYGACQIC